MSDSTPAPTKGPPPGKEEALALIGYQMRQPISGILGMTTLLADTSLSAEQRGYVDTIRSASETLLAMVRDLLDHGPAPSSEAQSDARRRALGTPARSRGTPEPAPAPRVTAPGRAAPAPGAAAPGPAPQVVHGRVLLAEDNPVNQKVAVGYLRSLGYAAEVAADGREAIEAIRRGDYDLILMDCQMPNVDGFDATRVIRLTESGSHLPILALTADVSEGNYNACLAAGMNEVLLKPVSREALGVALARWCGRPAKAEVERRSRR